MAGGGGGGGREEGGAGVVRGLGFCETCFFSAVEHFGMKIRRMMMVVIICIVVHACLLFGFL